MTNLQVSELTGPLNWLRCCFAGVAISCSSESDNGVNIAKFLLFFLSRRVPTRLTNGRLGLLFAGA